jgi:hypothetical protein
VDTGVLFLAPKLTARTKVKRARTSVILPHSPRGQPHIQEAMMETHCTMTMTTRKRKRKRKTVPLTQRWES